MVAAVAQQDGLPEWFRYSVLPLCLPVASAAYLAAHWSEIPARFPIHWGLNGRPDGWATRTPLHVFAFFIFAEGLCLWIVAMALTGYRGSRPSHARSVTLKVAFAVEWLMAIVFSGVGINELAHFPAWILPAVLGPAAIVLVAIMAKSYSAPVPAGEAPENTPDECWTIGGIYNNPNDPALMVQQRFGMGYTFNFGNPAAKRVLGVLIGGIVGLVGFLLVALR
jgi:uncharacterized membrane protein